MNDEQEYLAERGAFDRVAIRGEGFDVRTPEGAFMYSLYESFDFLRDQLNLSDDTRNTLVKFAKLLPDPGHKNAAAFIYAYKVTEKGRISQSMLNSLGENLSFGVALPDVLRYSRLFLTLQ